MNAFPLGLSAMPLIVADVSFPLVIEEGTGEDEDEKRYVISVALVDFVTLWCDHKGDRLLPDHR